MKRLLWKQHMRQSAYFRTLFVGNMVLVFMLTVIVGGLTFYNRNYVENTQITANHSVFLEQQRDRIDTRLSVAMQAIGILESDEQFVSYCRDDSDSPYWRAIASNRLRRIVNPLAGLGFSVACRKEHSDMIVDSDSSDTFNAYFSDWGLSAETIGALATYLANTEFTQQSYYTINSSVEVVEKRDVAFTVVYRKKYPDIGVLDFFIFFYQQDTLPTFENTEAEGFAVLDSGTVVTSSTPAYWDKTTEMVLANEELIQDVGQECQYVKHGGERFYVVRSGLIPNWNYVYAVRQGSLMVYNILLTTLLVVLLVLLVGSFVAFTNTKRSYSPIRAIITMLRGQGVGLPKDEMAFIQNAIISINNTNEELAQELEDREESLKLKVFSELLYGLLKREDIDRMVKTYHLERYLTPLCVVVMEFADYIDLDADRDVWVETNQAVLVGIGQLLTVSYPDSMAFQLDYKRFTVIVPCREREPLRDVLTSAIRNMEDSLDVSLLAFVGKQVDSLYEAPDSFSDAMFMLENKFTGFKRPVILAEDMAGLQETSFYYPIDMERNLLLYIEKGEMEKALTLLRRLLKINLYDHALSKEVLNEFIYSIVATIKRTLQQLELRPEDVFEEGSILYLDFRYCETPQQLEEKIIAAFTAIFNKAHEGVDLAGQSLIERVLAFVRDNYDRDVSLTDIADRFHISTGYISRLFKNEAKTTFKDYLNLYRVQRAKEMLAKDPSRKIAEVAGAVGCNNVGTFIRIFKRYDGISPGEYVKNLGDK